MNHLNCFMKLNDYKIKRYYGRCYTFENQLMDYEVEMIKRLAGTFPCKTALLSGNGEDNSYRRSTVRWIKNINESGGLFDKLGELVKVANKEFWGFDIVGFGENLQYGEYNSANKGFYDWHIDVGPNDPYRKISMSIQLTDPSEYEGGELQLKSNNSITTVSKKKGTIIFFPSFMLHRVTPVTKGVRHSLVGWITGPPFK